MLQPIYFWTSTFKN